MNDGDYARPETLAAVRRRVREMLEDSPAWRAAHPSQRRALARNLVKVSMTAADLAAEDLGITGRLRRRAPLARAQAAGTQLGMQAVNAASGAFAAMRDTINFPTYVQSLITGVFQAILSSSTQQVGALGELLDNVSASSDDFESTLSDAEVARWAAGKFSFLQLESEGVSLKPGTDLTARQGELQAGLGASSEEVSGIDGSDVSGTLLPLCKRAMGRNKQQVLASMVQMGLQRIVVDEGRIHASMDMRVDAASASTEDQQQRNDFRVNAGLAGSFGFGPWSASASASTSVGQVKSDHQLTSEQIGVRAGLRSSVDLAFRTEQVPLDRMADEHQRVRIASNARVPADVSAASTLPGIPSSFAPTSIEGVPNAPNAPALPPVSDARAARQQSLDQANLAGSAASGRSTGSPVAGSGSTQPPGGGTQPPGGGTQPPGGGTQPPGGGTTTAPAGNPPLQPALRRGARLAPSWIGAATGRAPSAARESDT